jgi:glycosyltransferase involved in cell wall biosynthesis
MLLEAVASGLPVISTQAGQMDDFLADFQKCITFIPFNEFVSLSRKIIDLIEDPERVERVTSEGKLISRNYYWHRIKSHWLGRYQ